MHQPSSLVDAIDAVLPQTQCTQCGYSGCRPYATAIATEGAPINRCPPGGDDGIRALAAVTGQAVQQLDPSCGRHQPLHLARIDEAHCIGCTLCIQACPVDAIVGANKLMHTVLADRCTGCELCVPPCPVDCIDMVPAGYAWTRPLADAAREHFHHRQRRLASLHHEAEGPAARTLANKAPVAAASSDTPETRQARIADALERARARRRQNGTPRP